MAAEWAAEKDLYSQAKDEYRKVKSNILSPSTIRSYHSPKYAKNAYGFLTAVLAMYQPNLKLSVTLLQAIPPNTH